MCTEGKLPTRFDTNAHRHLTQGSEEALQETTEFPSSA